MYGPTCSSNYLLLPSYIWRWYAATLSSVAHDILSPSSYNFRGFVLGAGSSCDRWPTRQTSKLHPRTERAWTCSLLVLLGRVLGFKSGQTRRSALNREETANDLRVEWLLLPVSLCSEGKHEGRDLTAEKKHPLGENPFQFAKCHFWITDI